MERGDLLSLGASVIRAESQALAEAAALIDERFAQAVEAIAQANAVFFSGVGKPYLVGTKTAASMASLGIRAMTIHPVDALHGDMGRVRESDVVLLASKSGTSAETLEFAKALGTRRAFRIALTNDADSPLADLCELTLRLPNTQEADPMGLVPTSSTAVLMAMGDALSVGVAEVLGIETRGFANNHPAGALGRQVLPVTQFMRSRERTPTVGPDTTVADTLALTSSLRAGAAFVVDGRDTLLGIFTDGDLRRALAEGRIDLRDTIEKHMSASPTRVSAMTRGKDALQLMREKKFDELAVVDEDNRLLGFVDIIDLS